MFLIYKYVGLKKYIVYVLQHTDKKDHKENIDIIYIIDYITIYAAII